MEKQFKDNDNVFTFTLSGNSDRDKIDFLDGCWVDVQPRDEFPYSNYVYYFSPDKVMSFEMGEYWADQEMNCLSSAFGMFKDDAVNWVQHIGRSIGLKLTKKEIANAFKLDKEQKGKTAPYHCGLWKCIEPYSTNCARCSQYQKQA